MKLTGFEDLRVQRTITSIYEAFEELICLMDYEKITVTELAKRAMINKKTFYRYYQTLDDLLAEMQARYTADYLKLVADFVYPRDLAKSQRTFFEYSARQGEAYDKITISTGAYAGIRQEMIDQVMGTAWKNSAELVALSDFQKVSLLTFVQNTGLSVYRQWVESGKVEPLENIIQTCINLTTGGVEKLLQNMALT